MKKSTLYILLPAYNESKSFPKLLPRIKKVMQKNHFTYRVVVVDDGSKDNSQSLLKKKARNMPIKVITHPYNRGLGETIRDGFEYVASVAKPQDILVRLDADDTHDPKYIPAMVDKINDGYDVVIASRFQPGGGAQGLNQYRTLISFLANATLKIFFPIPGIWEYSCGFRAYRVNVVKRALTIFGDHFIDLRGLGFTCTIEKLIKFRMMKAKITEVPFVLKYNQKVSASKMLSSITTLGYLVLILKYIYPWGKTGKEWQRQIRAINSPKSR